MKISNIVLSALAIFLMASCGKPKGQSMAEIDGITIDSIVKDSSVVLSGEKGSPTCDIKISLQYIKQGKNSEKINHAILNAGFLAPNYLFLADSRLSPAQAVDSFVKKYTDDYKKEYAPLYRSDRQHHDLYNCHYRLTTSTLSGKDNILTYIAKVSYYGGGMYETKQTLAKNIDMKSGQVLRLSDLFIHGYEDKVKALITKQLCERFKVDDIDGLASKMVFADGNAYIPDNFIIGKDDVTFIYCQDEIAPHEVGEIRVEIPNDALGDFLKIK